GSAARAAGEAGARTGRPPDPESLRRACEAAVRMTLAYVVAPAGSDTEAAEEVADVVRRLLDGGRE
ncbi:TetR/AcrR family transcriptional regulator, partial [Streptomyces sp. SCA2-4]|nr:TetR/AcrR family transcriptional regulator [Streptomyces huiliensis]